MNTALRTIVFMVDVMPMPSPDSELLFMVTESRFAHNKPVAGYTRFRVTVELDVPVSTPYTDVAPEFVKAEKED